MSASVDHPSESAPLHVSQFHADSTDLSSSSQSTAHTLPSTEDDTQSIKSSPHTKKSGMSEKAPYDGNDGTGPGAAGTPNGPYAPSGPVTPISPNGGGGPTATPGTKLNKYSYDLFAPELAPKRKMILKILAATLALMTVVMWGFLPLFWGSLWKSSSHGHALTVAVLNYDSDSPGSIGTAVLGQALANANRSLTNGSPMGVLGYFEASTTEFPVESVGHHVVENKWWAALVINPGATKALTDARAIGNSSYDPLTAVSFYYNQGRNELAANSFLVPITTQLLLQTVTRYGAESGAQYIGANSANATAMQALAQAPKTIAFPVGYTFYNLRPFSTPVGTAVTLVGLILILIFSFIFIMAWAGVRDIIVPFLTLRSLLVMRILVPMIMYIYLSLIFAMINLPFDVPFDAKFTYAGGFFLWWAFCWLGMCALGLAIDFGVTLVTAKFVGFFLLILVVVQVSVTTLPWQLQPAFYKYGLATPFNRLSNAVRTIIFNTKNELGKDAGILIAWIAISIITICTLTSFYRIREVKREKKENNPDLEAPQFMAEGGNFPRED